jgi:hypothetical protein
MRDTFGKQAERAGVVLAAAGALAALGITTALAAPPTPDVPTFASVKFSIEAGNGGAETAPAAGGLTCAWRETGLHPFQLIVYNCDAEVVGAVEACVYKNKLVGGSPALLSVFRHPLAILGGEAEGFVSNNKGQINGTTTTAVPVSEGGHGGELCPEPWQAEVVAVRWCNVSLTDTANDLVGGPVDELSVVSYAGLPPVPSCAELLELP